MKMRPLYALLALMICAIPRLQATDLLFELGFEEGLKPSGSVADGVITERGGGLAESHRGKAWEFDGKAALELALPHQNALSFAPDDQFTLEASICLSERRSSGALISKGSGAEYRISVAADRTIGFAYYSQGQWRSYTSPALVLPVLEWAVVTVQYDGVHRNVTVLIDGKLLGRFPVEAPLQSRSAAPLFIGGSVNAETGEAKGISATMDDIRIYSGVKYPEAQTAEMESLLSAPQS